MNQKQSVKVDESAKLAERWNELINESAEHYYKDLEFQKDKKIPTLELDLEELEQGEFEDMITYMVDEPLESIDVLKGLVKDMGFDDLFVVLKRSCAVVEADMKSIRQLTSDDIGKVVVFKGLVRNSTGAMPKLKLATFDCNNKSCSTRFSIIQNDEEANFEGARCPQCKTEIDECTFRDDKSMFVDFMKCEIEEDPEGLGGKQPERISCEIFGPLTSYEKRVGVGDRVTILGIYRTRKKDKKGLVYAPYIQVLGFFKRGKNYEDLKISPEEEKRFLEMSKDKNLLLKMAKAVAPNINGHDVEKSAIVLQMVGGNQYSTDRRGDIHILLIGDPGVGKSMMVRNIASVAPHVVKASGAPTTSVGLTACVRKDDDSAGGFVLEAGAAVLADGGLLIIDEFDKMDKEVRGALHEIMEDQVCYDDQTELLTESGWKKFSDLNRTEKVATLNNFHELEYQLPTNYISKNYKGKMYNIKNRQLDINVTEGHKVYYSPSRGRGIYGPYELTDVAETINGRGRMKKNASWNGKNIEYYEVPSITIYKNQNCNGNESGPVVVDGDVWMEFLGYFISEGCVTNEIDGVHYNVVISQKDGWKSEVIKNCLDKMPFKYSKIGKNYIIYSKQLAAHLEELGKAREKFIPQYAKNASSRQIQILLDALVLGNGTIKNKFGGIVYITSSKKLADDVSECLLKIGWSGNVQIQRKTGTKCRLPKGRSFILSGPIYSVAFIKPKLCSPGINTKGRKQVYEREYDGNVYCVEVPNHVIYVRRNGIPAWCGNCSVSKANINTVLRTKCAVLAIMNPKRNRFNSDETIAEQIDLPPSLLSRFDLIFAIRDIPTETKDRKICDAILRSRQGNTVETEYTVEDITRYIIYAKSKIHNITFSEEAIKLLTDKFVEIRGLSGKDSISITSRQMEGLSRLSEACAKVRLSEVVEGDDARMAIALLDYYLNTMCINPDTGKPEADKTTGNRTSTQMKSALDIKNLIKNYYSELQYKDTNYIDFNKLKKKYDEVFGDGKFDLRFTSFMRDEFGTRTNNDNCVVLKGEWFKELQHKKKESLKDDEGKNI